MKKNWNFYILIIAIILIPKMVYAEDTAQNTINTKDIIEEQESSFGIKDFLKETENYTPDYIKDLNISQIFTQAIEGKIDNKGFLKKILSLLKSEIKNSLKVLINIFVIILIHSLLKAITDGLENNNVSKIVYFVQYILIVTIIMSSFSNILNEVNKTIGDLVRIFFTFSTTTYSSYVIYSEALQLQVL